MKTFNQNIKNVGEQSYSFVQSTESIQRLKINEARIKTEQWRKKQLLNRNLSIEEKVMLGSIAHK